MAKVENERKGSTVTRILDFLN